MNDVWCHKYMDQNNSNNWKTTTELYEFWLDKSRLKFEVNK